MAHTESDPPSGLNPPPHFQSIQLSQWHLPLATLGMDSELSAQSGFFILVILATRNTSLSIELWVRMMLPCSWRLSPTWFIEPLSFFHVAGGTNIPRNGDRGVWKSLIPWDCLTNLWDHFPMLWGSLWGAPYTSPGLDIFLSPVGDRSMPGDSPGICLIVAHTDSLSLHSEESMHHPRTGKDSRLSSLNCIGAPAGFLWLSSSFIIIAHTDVRFLLQIFNLFAIYKFPSCRGRILTCLHLSVISQGAWSYTAPLWCSMFLSLNQTLPFTN